MSKQAPTLGRLLAMVLFALSCFGLLLFLWTSFGGPAPLKPKGYRLEVPFDEATQLTQNADVRVSGVPIGKVVALDTDGQGRTLATLELRARYAPVHRDARATLRLKTLLGETFVELTRGTPDAPLLPEGARLPRSQVQGTVELDEVLRAFDAPTRRAFKRGLQGAAAILRDRGPDLNDALGGLAGTAQRGAGLLAVLHAQEDALSHGVRDTGRVFAALGRDDGAVRRLVTSADRVLRTTARRDPDVRALLRRLPTFQDELRPTLEEADRLLADARPVLAQLRRAAPDVRPVLRDGTALAPELERLFADVDPVVRASAAGLPALRRTVDAARPLVGVLDPLARDLRPVADYVGRYQRELMQSWMNVAASTQATFKPAGAQGRLHYLRVLIPIWTEALVNQAKRLPTNRHNAYLAPGALAKLGQGGLESFSCSHTSNPPALPALGTAPPCKVQAPWAFGGQTAAFPRLREVAP
ncbi:MlaD family protein [Conexibacter sp. SYSU D00693]|uniref:MlaD family protein n=1 Tax=Conexibacter sp. SYSU D00693 TaxID=2812560 RepID=UPI00196AAFC8|nr:MlaD family protein [Conexibacter sp. SYSU D00693]